MSDLNTLAFRVDPARLGSVTKYSLTGAFAEAWATLTAAARARSNNGAAQPSYWKVATALTATTGQPVRIFPNRGRSPEGHGTALLATTRPIDPWLLQTVFQSFAELSGNPGLNLGALALDVSHDSSDVAEHVNFSGGAVLAPGWVYDVARWNYAEILSNAVLTIDGVPLALRSDTDGNLLAWENPIIHQWGDRPGQRDTATGYLETRIVTIPGAQHLYFRVEPRVARMPSWWGDAKNAWVVNGTDRPILAAPVLGPWPNRELAARYGQDLARIIEACQLNPLPTLPADARSLDTSLVRLRGNPSKHSIGRGHGVRFAYQVREQLAGLLHCESPTFRRTGLTVGTSQTGPIASSDLDAAVVASGVEKLRILVLYRAGQTRLRASSALARYTAAGRLNHVEDDVEMSLSEHVTVVFRYAPKAVAHGAHDRELDTIPGLRAPAATAVVALAETDFAAAKEAGSTDAKPILRRELGRHGVVVQFLNVTAAANDETPDTDHRADNAVRDLFRQAGIIDARLSAIAIPQRANQAPLDRAATLVGIHLRHNTPRKRDQKASLVIRLVAVHAEPTKGEPWPITMYDDELGWIPYREAVARTFNRPIGSESFGRSSATGNLVRDYVDQALRSLPAGVPPVLFVDVAAGGARMIWPGLRNPSHGRGSLPGDGSQHRDVAVVRVAVDDDTLRPTNRTHGRQPADASKPALTGADLYHHDENDADLWLLTQKSRVFRSAQIGARIGADFTRWSLPPAKDRSMRDDWHLLTATEISVPRPGPWDRSQLAALTARLCHQAVSWDDRTKYPAPLHLARAADMDHPGYAPDESAG